MYVQASTRNMPLRQVLTHAEKCSRDLIEAMRASLKPVLQDFHDLCEPVRRRGHYPTRLALRNGLQKVEEAGAETLHQAEALSRQLSEIRDRVRREHDRRYGLR